MKEDFYIGWSDNTPKSSLKAGRRFFVSALILLLVIAVVFVTNQVGYADSKFEFGTLTEVKGTLIKEPAWGVKTKLNGESKTVILVGFGKFGAQETIEGFIEQGKLKAGDEVTLRGTLFYFQGKYGMELTEVENSYISSSVGNNAEVQSKDLGEVMLEGEIVDSKCFFGVMNPATHAVHRSCAIRCISGGITPFFAVKNGNEFTDYYIIENAFEEWKDELLSYVGLPTKVMAKAKQYGDWKAIELMNQNMLASEEDELSTLMKSITICD